MIDHRDVVISRALAQQNLDLMGSRFRAAIPVSKDAEFDDLLAAIDAGENRSARQSS